MLKTYKVKSGDTLRGIAQQFYNDPAKYTLIAEANEILIKDGQELQIPLAALPVSPAAAAIKKTYKVKKGDTLRGIALRFYNDPAKYILIAEANEIRDPNLIKVGQVLEIPSEGIPEPVDDEVEEHVVRGLTSYHRAFPDGIAWRLTTAGVDIQGSGIERTAGKPQTVTRIWETYNREINRWAEHYQVPDVLIIAIIATESGGNPRALRKEPGYVSEEASPHRASVGLMQTLVSTARDTLDNSSINQAWLLDPGNSIQAGTSYVAEQRPKTNLDPPKVACAYNAGGVYHNRGVHNRWKMRQYPIGTGEHCDRFVKWFNDAVFVLKNHRIRPSVAYEIFYLV